MAKKLGRPIEKEKHVPRYERKGFVTTAMVMEALKAAGGHPRTYEQVAARYSLPKEAAYPVLDVWTRRGWVNMRLATIDGKQRRVFTLTAAGKVAFAELASPKAEEQAV
jgi:hypothetical protein